MSVLFFVWILSTVCNFKSECDELLKEIKSVYPNAEVVCRQGRRGSFEVAVNDTLIHSKLASMAFPTYGDVVENVKYASEGQPLKKVKEQPITDCIIQ